MRKRGGKQTKRGLSPVVVPSHEFSRFQFVYEPIRRLFILNFQHRDKVRNMSHARRLLAPCGKVFGAPDSGLKTDIHLADVVQGRENAQACGSRSVQILHTARASQPLAHRRVSQQRLEASSDIGQVVLQQMNALMIFSICFRPMMSGIYNQALSFLLLFLPGK